MADILKQILGGIISAMIIVIYAFAFFSITTELKKASPSEEATEIIENIEKSVSNGIRWYYVVGGINFISWNNCVCSLDIR